MLGKPAFPASCCKMNLIRKQVIYWHWVCIHTVMIFILPITANCKVCCQFKQSCYFVLLGQEVFISSLGLTELESFFEENKAWSMYEVWKTWSKSMPSLSDQLLLEEYGLETWDISVEVGTQDFPIRSQTENYNYSFTGVADLQIIFTSRAEMKCSVSNMFVYKRSYLSE